MKVDLGGGEVGVSKEFLDGSEVVVVVQEMSGEAVAQRLNTLLTNSAW
jgi:hypothetical protein